MEPVLQLYAEIQAEIGDDGADWLVWVCEQLHKHETLLRLRLVYKLIFVSLLNLIFVFESPAHTSTHTCSHMRDQSCVYERTILT